MAGDLRAINVVLTVINSRIRLLGLDQYGSGHLDATPQVLVVGPAEGLQGGNR